MQSSAKNPTPFKGGSVKGVVIVGLCILLCLSLVLADNVVVDYGGGPEVSISGVAHGEASFFNLVSGLILSIVSPVNDSLESSPVSFVVNHSSDNPDKLIISINGTNYSFPYSGEQSVHSIALATGNYSWYAWINDTGGFSVQSDYYLLSVFQPITFSNKAFNPSPPRTGVNNNVSVVISGDAQEVIISYRTSSSNWTNVSLGSGPGNYSYVVPGGILFADDFLYVNWYAKDPLGVWRTSSLTSKIYNPGTGGGGSGSPEDFGEELGLKSVCDVSLEPRRFNVTSGLWSGVEFRDVYIDSKNGGVVRVHNPTDETFIVTRIYIRDLLGSLSKDLVLSKDEMIIAPGSVDELVISPRSSFTSVNGLGEVVLESDECFDIAIPINADISFWRTVGQGFGGAWDYLKAFFGQSGEIMFGVLPAQGEIDNPFIKILYDIRMFFEELVG